MYNLALNLFGRLSLLPYIISLASWAARKPRQHRPYSEVVDKHVNICVDAQIATTVFATKIRAISKCRWASAATLQGSFPLGVNLLLSHFVPATGEQPRLAGCGLCFLCCDWMSAHACVISCGTCSSSTPDSAWQSLVAPPTHNYIMTHEQRHACLLTPFGVIRQVTLPRMTFLLPLNVFFATSPSGSSTSERLTAVLFFCPF